MRVSGSDEEGNPEVRSAGAPLILSVKSRVEIKRRMDPGAQITGESASWRGCEGERVWGE